MTVRVVEGREVLDSATGKFFGHESCLHFLCPGRRLRWLLNTLPKAWSACVAERLMLS